MLFISATQITEYLEDVEQDQLPCLSVCCTHSSTARHPIPAGRGAEYAIRPRHDILLYVLVR